MDEYGASHEMTHLYSDADTGPTMIYICFIADGCRAIISHVTRVTNDMVLDHIHTTSVAQVCKWGTHFPCTAVQMKSHDPQSKSHQRGKKTL